MKEDAPPRHARLAEGLALVEFLAAHRAGRTVRAMQAELGCGRRTVERLMRAVESICGPLEECPADGREKRWRLRRAPLLQAGGARPEELAELERSAAALERAGVPHRAEALRRARMRLAARQDLAAFEEGESMADALLAAEGVAFRPGPRQGVDAAVLGAIRDAVLRRRLLGMTYTDGAGRRRERVVEPCGIVHGQRAFLLAALPDKPHAVLWRLDRMAAVMVRREGFRPRFDLRREMADCFGVGRDAVMDVVLRFAAGAAAREAEGWCFHPSQTQRRLAGGALEVRFRAQGLPEMAHHLATWGAAVEVAQPPALREALAELGRTLVAQHG